MSLAADLKQLEGDVGELIARHDTRRNAKSFTKYNICLRRSHCKNSNMCTHLVFKP